MTGWICQIFLLIQHTAFSAHKTLHLLEFGWLFSLTWHCDRRITPPSILLGNETERFFSFSSFLWFTWHWVRRMSFFVSLFLSFGREGGRRGKEEEQEEGSKLQSSTHKEERDDCVKKTDLRDEKRHKGLSCSLYHHLHQLPLSQGGSQSVFTCTVVIKAKLWPLKLSHKIQSSQFYINLGDDTRRPSLTVLLFTHFLFMGFF